MPTLDKDKVTQAVLDCSYKLDMAADKLGVPFMELDAFIEEHPSLRSLLKIGNAVPPADLEVIDKEKLLPAEVAGSTQPLLNEQALVAVLKSAGVRGNDMEDHINRVKYYRELDRDRADVVNANLLINHIHIAQACEAIKTRVLENNYASTVDAAKDNAALARFSKLLLEQQQQIAEAKLVEAKVKHLLREGQFKSQQQQQAQQPVQRGKAGWKPKQKLVQINTTGDVFLNETKS